MHLATGPRFIRPLLYVQTKFPSTHVTQGLLMSQRTLRTLHRSQARSAVDFDRPFGTPTAVSRVPNMVVCDALRG